MWWNKLNPHMIIRDKQVLAGQIALMCVGLIWTTCTLIAASLSIAMAAILIVYAIWGSVDSLQRQLFVIEAALLVFVYVKAYRIFSNAFHALGDLYYKFWPIVYQK
jgi:hypothetical protein